MKSHADITGYRLNFRQLSDMNKVVEAFKLQSDKKAMSSFLLVFLKSVKIRRKSFPCVVVVDVFGSTGKQTPCL